MSATPRPWTIEDLLHLEEADDRDFALRAVNSHDKLAAAAADVRSYCIPGMNWTDDMGQLLLQRLDAALALARGETP